MTQDSMLVYLTDVYCLFLGIYPLLIHLLVSHLKNIS